MGDGVSDLIARGEASDEECEAAVLQEIQKADGVITWWPGGRHHGAICRLRDKGLIRLVDASGFQEPKFLVYLKEPNDG